MANSVYTPTSRDLSQKRRALRRAKAHPRNKSDEELRAIAQKGGFVGVTLYPPS
jgi:Membrane dipeptidase (Peptidase family M19)